MFLKKIQSINFRNLSNDIFEFSERINCIFGENGNGKTNLLELIHILTNKKSFRKKIGFPHILSAEGDKSEIYISSLISNKNMDQNFSLKLNQLSEEKFLNGQVTKNRTNLRSVFVNPFDSYQFHQSASFRRDWIDNHLCVLDINYKKKLSRFTKCLRQRNALLGIKTRDTSQEIRAIDQQFCELSYFIQITREEFVQNINDQLSTTFKAIFSQNHHLSLSLKSHVKAKSVEDYHNFYRKIEDQDRIIGLTRCGVHRDDYEFYFDGILSYEYCSLGQQKMSFLSLIFAFIEIFFKINGAYPIVLVDDVSGELDSQRWKNLIQYLDERSFQVMITTANESFQLELKNITHSKEIILTNGSLWKMTDEGENNGSGYRFHL